MTTLEDRIRLNANARRCFVAVIRDDGYSIGIAVEGEPGYYATNYQSVATYEEAKVWASKCNANMGINDAEASEIVLNTMMLQNRAARGF